jgi:cytoskeletal protein RodZ
MSLETAGARLKKIRQERGLSLEDIQKKTKIHINVLRAIEGDSISNLSPIYLKGFIKIYCNCLGLDLKDFIGEANQPPHKPVLNSTVGKDLGERLERKPVLLAKGFTLKLKRLRPPAWLKKAVIFAAIALIALFLIVKLAGLVFSLGKKLSARPGPGKVAAVSRELLPKEAINKSSAKNISKQPNSQQAVAQGFILGIFARNKTWVSAKVDGKTVFHGVLARGRSEMWQAKNEIELSIGDAGAVELQVNDQRFTKLGRRGQALKNIIINKEGMKISR